MKLYYFMLLLLISQVLGANAAPLNRTSSSLASLPTANAETNTPFTRLAELAVRKGYKNISLGPMICNNFDLAGRSEDIACLVYQLSSRIDDGDAKKYGIAIGTNMALNTFVEKGTGILRIIIGERDRDDQDAYVFLTNQQGQLLKAMIRVTAHGEEYWQPLGITTAVKAKFAREVAYWIGSLPEIEQLPKLTKEV